MDTWTEDQDAEKLGPLALVGLLADVGDEKIDAMVKKLYAERRRSMPRPVMLEP